MFIGFLLSCLYHHYVTVHVRNNTVLNRMEVVSSSVIKLKMN